ncbi:MAG: ABC transporter permease [Gammaproteobacteria bacterium]|nr:ABC transporter permease [Gammaproteobacteria bacterium]
MLIWELNSRLGIYTFLAPNLPSEFFPNFIDLFNHISNYSLTIDYLNEVQLTVLRTLAAFFLAASSSILIALIAARAKLIDDLIYIPFEFIRNIPAVSIMPLLIIAFGIGGTMKIAVSFFGAAFPIFVASRKGFRDIPESLLRTAKSYKWSGTNLLFGVMLPAALPAIFGGLRIGLSISYILIITAEMLVGPDGLGQRLISFEREFNFVGLYAEIFLLGLIGVVLNSCLTFIEKKVIYWKTDSEWSQ